MSQKRVAAIHDISCFGKCSLTVALPIISAAGIETAVIPTAVLSTHTGGFTGYTFRNLGEDILPIANHWAAEKITFDAIYTGYLGSKEQVEIVKQAIGMLKTQNTVVIVDPVMADNGRLYSGFPPDFSQRMRGLCQMADIITPNLTEACMMLGMPYKDTDYDEEYISGILHSLHEMTGKNAVLTGVCFDTRRIGAGVIEDGAISYVFSERIAASYHGTGDVFASVFTAAYMNGRSIKASAQIAAGFTSGCIKRTMAEQKPPRYGVNFEAEIPNLIKYLELN